MLRVKYRLRARFRTWAVDFPEEQMREDAQCEENEGDERDDRDEANRQ